MEASTQTEPMVDVPERPNEAAAIAHATAESASSNSPSPTPGAHPTTDHVPASTGLSSGGGSASATADYRTSGQDHPTPGHDVLYSSTPGNVQTAEKTASQPMQILSSQCHQADPSIDSSAADAVAVGPSSGLAPRLVGHASINPSTVYEVESHTTSYRKSPTAAERDTLASVENCSLERRRETNGLANG